MAVDLIWIGSEATKPDPWSGVCVVSERHVATLDDAVDRVLETGSAELVLFWDERLGPPDAGAIEKVGDLPGDGWHAGLRLGTGGKPASFDLVAPTTMLNLDADDDIVSTSWRLTCAAFLIKRSALHAMRPIDRNFESLAGAALDLGYRCIKGGVLLRHVPDLVPKREPGSPHGVPSLKDEFVFTWKHFGRRWAMWVLLFWTIGRSRRRGALAAYRDSSRTGRAIRQLYDRQVPTVVDVEPFAGNISVIIPTIDRYPYLARLLENLEAQTIAPREVLVVDQTEVDRRDRELGTSRTSLPLKVIEQETPGQSSSRNAALQRAEGEFILLLDDDIEAEPDLIEQHARLLAATQADVSAGVADEIGTDLPDDFKHVRAANIFPTGNTLLRRSALTAAGLFDLAFNHGDRADHDIGTRLYLAGTLSVLNPMATVLHHRAPRGGLRTHKARRITYSMSRNSLTARNTPSPTQVYLWKRYYSDKQVRMALRLRTLATLSSHGSRGMKLVRAFAAVVLLPNTMMRIRRSMKAADRLRASFPQIPALDERSDIR